MKLCIFETEGGLWRCLVCGSELRGKWNQNNLPPRNCPAVQSEPVSPCPYLGQAIEGDIVTINLLSGCKKNRKRETKQFIIHDCAIMGRAMPAYTCCKEAIETLVAGDWAEPCKFCEHNPKNRRIENG